MNFLNKKVNHNDSSLYRNLAPKNVVTIGNFSLCLLYKDRFVQASKDALLIVLAIY